MARARNYNQWHVDQLRKEHVEDPTYIAGYLSACLGEGEDVFLLGLKKVAQALGGISELAAETNLSRKHLYTMLSEGGNPTLASISSVLNSLGMQLQCVPTPDS